MSEQCRLSAIVCTNRDAYFVKRTLESLHHQTVDSNQCEIIIVNNSPEHLVFDEVVEKWPRENVPKLRVVECLTPGLSHARNVGLHESQGDIVLYLDDDIVADTQLFKAILEAYEQLPDAGVIGGAVKLHVPDSAPGWYGPNLAKFWSEYMPEDHEAQYCNVWTRYPFGANWSARRKCLLEVGGFQTRYGRGSGAVASGEETVAAIEIQRKGYRIGATPAARVVHHIDADRFTREELWKIGLHNFDTVVAMSVDGYIEPFWGGWGCLGRGVAKFGLAWLPGLRSRSERLELRVIARGHFRTAFQLLSKRSGS